MAQVVLFLSQETTDYTLVFALVHTLLLTEHKAFLLIKIISHSVSYLFHVAFLFDQADHDTCLLFLVVFEERKSLKTLASRELLTLGKSSTSLPI